MRFPQNSVLIIQSRNIQKHTVPSKICHMNSYRLKFSVRLSFPSSVTLLVRRRQNSFPCLIFLSQFSRNVCSVRWILSPLYLSATEFPLIDGKTVSAPIQSKMNFGFMKCKVWYKKKKTNRPRKISYREVDLAPFCSSHYPVSESDDWELSTCVRRVWVCRDWAHMHANEFSL